MDSDLNLPSAQHACSLLWRPRHELCSNRMHTQTRPPSDTRPCERAPPFQCGGAGAQCHATQGAFRLSMGSSLRHLAPPLERCVRIGRAPPDPDPSPESARSSKTGPARPTPQWDPRSPGVGASTRDMQPPLAGAGCFHTLPTPDAVRERHRTHETSPRPPSCGPNRDMQWATPRRSGPSSRTRPV